MSGGENDSSANKSKKSQWPSLPQHISLMVVLATQREGYNRLHVHTKVQQRISFTETVTTKQLCKGPLVAKYAAMHQLGNCVVALQCKELSERALDHKPKQATNSQPGSEAQLVHSQPAEQ